MTRIELDRMLEKTVAEAIGVPYHAKPIKRAYKPRSAAAYQPLLLPQLVQNSSREMSHA